MSTKNLEGFAATSQVVCTLTSLGIGSARESAIVVNTTNLDLDYQIAVTFTIASGTPGTASPAVNIYANGSADATLWPIIMKSTAATYQTGGGDSSVGSLGTPNNLRMLGAFGIQTTTSSGERTFRTQPFSVAQAFGGVVPAAFSIIVENQTGVVFSASTTTSATYIEAAGVFTTSGN